MPSPNSGPTSPGGFSSACSWPGPSRPSFRRTPSAAPSARGCRPCSSCWPWAFPFYICATASTPIAAALILKGVSPGAALVFLLAGPATNVATLTVLVNILGKRAAVIYLLAIAVCAVLFGLAVDQVYAVLGRIRQGRGGQGGGNHPLRGSVGCRRGGADHIRQAGRRQSESPVPTLPAFAEEPCSRNPDDGRG